MTEKPWSEALQHLKNGFHQKAIELATPLARKKSGGAMYVLGCALLKTNGSVDDMDGWSWIHDAEKCGSYPAGVMLARKLLDNFNNNIRGDIRIRFFNYLEAGLDAKFPPSCYYMALLLAGEGDIEEAFHLFKNAAEKKYPPAQYELAQMYWYGNDYVKQSYQRALVWGIGALANGMQDASWIVEDCQERLSWQEVRKAQEAAESKIRDV